MPPTPSDLQQQIHQVLERLAASLTAVFRQGIIASFSARATALPLPHLTPLPPADSSSNAPPEAPRARPGPRPSHSPEEIEQIGHEILALLGEKPGNYMTSKALRDRLSVDERPFRSALRSLMDSRRVQQRGAGRGARYAMASRSSRKSPATSSRKAPAGVRGRGAKARA